MSAEDHSTGRSVSLQGQVALVTGGGRGIGRAIAQALAGAGASVAVIARSKNEIDETVGLIRQAGHQALAVAADVTDEHGVTEALKVVERELGPVNILINNAAALKPFGPFWETSIEEWWRTMEVNLLGVALCTHAVLPGMVARGHGHIVNVSSGAGAVSTPYYTAYTASKAALIRFTECLALEAGPQGVALFAISPGTVRTAMAEYSLGSEEGRKWLPWFKRIFDEGFDVPAERAADLVVRLVSGKYDILSGKMFSIFDDLERLKAGAPEIEQRNLYSLKMESLATGLGTPAMSAILAAARQTAKKSS